MMIAQRIDDFDEVILILKRCMKENQWVVDLTRGELVRVISKQIGSGEDEVDTLKLCKLLKEKVENIAYKTNLNDKLILIDGTRWMVYYHHLYLLYGIARCVPEYYKDVIQQLNYNGLLCRKIRLAENQLIAIFKYSLFLYLLAGREKIDDRYNRRWFEGICNALKYFKNIPYEIKEGEIDFTPQGHLLIHQRFEAKIKRIGGVKFLDYCRELLLEPSYNELFDRYVIYRKKSTTPDPDTIPLGQVPVYYLIKLGMKNITAATNFLENEKTRQIIFEEICSEARAYMYILNLSSDSIYEDLMISIDEVPRYIVKNLIYDSLLVPDQLNRSYLLAFIKKVFQPVIDTTYPELSGYVRRYRHLARCVFSLKKNIFTVKDLKRRSRLNNEELNEILSGIVLDCDKVNCDFTHVNSATNFQIYPLVRLPNGNLYRFDNHISAYGFYCSLYNRLNIDFKNKNINLNKSLGKQIEKFVVDMLENCKWSVKKGSYSFSKGDIQECDGVIENDENIIGIEMKYCRFLKDFSTGDDVKMFDVLARGMLKAYKQNLKHYYDLRHFGYLPLVTNEKSSEKNKLIWNNRRFISVSLCSSEYRFFSAGLLSRRLLNAIFVADINTYNSERQEELKNLKDIQLQIREQISKFQIMEDKQNIKRLRHNVLFVSVPQLYIMCQLQRKGFDLIEQLRGLLSVSCGTMDIYAELAVASKLRKLAK